MYSPGAISLSASRFLFSSVTAVRPPAGTDFAGRVVSTISPPAMASFRVVPAGTAWAETNTVRGCGRRDGPLVRSVGVEHHSDHADDGEEDCGG